MSSFGIQVHISVSPAVHVEGMQAFQPEPSFIAWQVLHACFKPSPDTPFYVAILHSQLQPTQVNTVKVSAALWLHVFPHFSLQRLPSDFMCCSSRCIYNLSEGLCETCLQRFDSHALQLCGIVGTAVIWAKCWHKNMKNMKMRNVLMPSIYVYRVPHVSLAC